MSFPHEKHTYLTGESVAHGNQSDASSSSYPVCLLSLVNGANGKAMMRVSGTRREGTNMLMNSSFDKNENQCKKFES